MKITEILIKVMALMLMLVAVSFALLRETLLVMAIEKHSPLALVKSKTNDVKDEENAPQNIIDKCRKTVIAGENEDIPFLCNDIEYSCISKNETVVFYNTNQIMEYNTLYGVCIKYYYKCPVGQKKYKSDELEKKANLEYVSYNAVDSLSNTNTKALLIYSSDDQMCKKVHYDILKEKLSNNENISFLLEDNKSHNPNYSKEAVKLLNEFSKERAKLLKNKKITKEDKERFVASFDWDKMTIQDENVWDKIFKHLEE